MNGSLLLPINLKPSFPTHQTRREISFEIAENRSSGSDLKTKDLLSL